LYSNSKAKPENHTKDNDEDTAYRPAAQIFAEMLKQADGLSFRIL